MTKKNEKIENESTNTAGDIPGEDRAIYRVEHDPAPQVASDNPSIQQQKDAIAEAMGLLAYATTLDVNIPDPDGDRDVDFASEDQTGEVFTTKCRVANRYGRMQRGLLDQVLRQLTFAVNAESKEFAQGQQQLRSMFNTLTRADDPERIRDAMSRKASYLDLVKERWAHAQTLLDAANVAYIDLTGTAYTSYEERRQNRSISVPSAPSSDPVLAKCEALLKS